jgi:hypothetical protein
MRFKRKALAQRIRSEIPELDRAVGAVLRHWERAKAVPEDQDAFLNSVALNLHGFYNGIERVLELIAVDLDGAILGGDAWYTELLRQVELEVPSLRPAVISSETRRRLDEYRRFRHRLRNIYAANLNASQLEGLVSQLMSTWEILKAEFTAFADYLDSLSDNG